MKNILFFIKQQVITLTNRSFAQTTMLLVLPILLILGGFLVKSNQLSGVVDVANPEMITDEEKEFIEILKKDTRFNASMEDEESIFNQLRLGRIDFAMIQKKDQLHFYVTNQQQSIRFINQYNQFMKSDRAHIQYNQDIPTTIDDKAFNSLQISLSLFMMLIAIRCITGPQQILVDKEKSIVNRLYVSSKSLFSYYASNFIASFMIMAVQVFIPLAIVYTIVREEISITVGQLFTVGMFILIVSLLIAYILSVFCKGKENLNLILTVLSIVFLVDGLSFYYHEGFPNFIRMVLSQLPSHKIMQLAMNWEYGSNQFSSAHLILELSVVSIALLIIYAVSVKFEMIRSQSSS